MAFEIVIVINHSLHLWWIVGTPNPIIGIYDFTTNLYHFFIIMGKKFALNDKIY